jgi:hypothetical protein
MLSSRESKRALARGTTDMAMPEQQMMLVDGAGKRLKVDALIERLRKDQARVLADDEVGLVFYVGDLGIYSLKPTQSGAFLAQRVTEISRTRFSTQVLRRQIGATVLSVTADAPFVIRDGRKLKKVRAEKLKAGMLLASGERVYW